ncbi:MAG: hypothetical protein AABW51_03210 [Nanoarchaeota archaeon]
MTETNTLHNNETVYENEIEYSSQISYKNFPTSGYFKVWVDTESLRRIARISRLKRILDCE